MIQVTINFYSKDSGKLWSETEHRNVTIQKFIETQEKILEEDETIEILDQTPYMAIFKIKKGDSFDIFICDNIKESRGL